MPFPLPNGVVNIGQDVQWNVNKHRICKLSITDCVFNSHGFGTRGK
jgi:hypothetical protein